MLEFIKNLIVICDKIDEYFPHSVKHLKVSTDPCSGDKGLVLMVITKLEIKDAMERLERFDNEWWFKQPDELTANLIIML